ncbi:MAG TPA: (S)-ureidoglycine aminohydrolase [Verrucomicrobiae bacterium]|jgi:(S)-ureidoglycine aminohydrolase|nr:(S)-ureidoglycine aminohydrolase [Verrucomicrobiae bacterium]
MTELFGATRNVVKDRYALLTPSGFVPSMLPGWENVTCNVLISPAMGARFCQFLITLGKEGQGRGNTGDTEYFVYVIEGNASVTFNSKRNRLEAGSFVYVPPGKDIHFHGSDAKLLIFQKIYVPLAGSAVPDTIIGHQREVKGQPFLGNEDARLQVLLYDDPRFDMAVNIFTYQPGATLPFVETHVMEHGLLMLSGQGVYRLGCDYHPVQTNDVIWMAPYCPQWFVAMGKTPASYIYYKDVNRDPM